jgi:tRNA threonylcarbamoyl adenosine modification protein (Sua5/YciO/YrdC/YwlC family)
MQIISITDPHAISLACNALSRGELVIYPTETCYGIAADATNPDAVTKLLIFKGDRHRQVAIAVSDRAMAKKYVKLNEIAINLYAKFLPGPITVISDSLHAVDPRLESATGTLGIRIPNYPITLLLINRFGRPITATSANTSGKKEPYSLADWQKYTTPDKQNMVSLFLDAGKLRIAPQYCRRHHANESPNSAPRPAGYSCAFPRLHHDFTGSLQQFAMSLHKYLPSPSFPDPRPPRRAWCGQNPVRQRCRHTRHHPQHLLPHLYSHERVFVQGRILYHLDTWRLYLKPWPELESTLHLKSLLSPATLSPSEAGKPAVTKSLRKICTNFSNQYKRKRCKYPPNHLRLFHP